MNTGSFKDFNNVTLSSPNTLVIGSKTYEANEPILYFDSIKIAFFDAANTINMANGGFDNRDLVLWQNMEKINLSFSQGTFSKEQFALMTNSTMANTNNAIYFHCHEELESDVNKQITCAHIPAKNIFLYDAAQGTKLTFTQSSNILTIDTAYKDVIVEYDYLYNTTYNCINLGRQLVRAPLQLEGSTNFKDENTGTISTCVIKIPKLQLLDNFSIYLGANASPITTAFNGIALPYGERLERSIIDFYYL